MSPTKIVLERIGVQPPEQGLFGWGSLCLFLIGAASLALQNTAETLFLKRIGVEAMPIAMLIGSGLLVVTSTLIGRIASRDPQRWLARILGCLALSPLPFVLLSDSESPIVLGALVLIGRQILALGLLTFWLTMGTLVPGRRAKQLFGPLGAGVTIGCIVGSFGSGPLAQWIGVDGLIGLSGATMLGATLVSLLLRRNSTRRLEGQVARAPARRPSSDVGLFDLLRGSRLFRFLGLAMFCGGILSPVLYFEFTSVLDAATQGPGGEERMLALYSQFRGWLNVATLVSQLSLSTFLYRTLGLPLTMALWPAVYALGFSWISLDFALVAAFTSFGATRVTEDGITESAARVLYNLFPDTVRNQATGLLEGPVNRTGGVLGNASVLGALALGGAAWIGWAAVPIAVIWLGSALVLWRAYPGLLLRASAEHGLVGAGIDRATLLDAATLRRLAAGLTDPDPSISQAAIDLVADGEPVLVVGLLSEAIENAPASHRPALIEALHRLVEHSDPASLRDDEALRALARALRAKHPLPSGEHADLLRIYARLTSAESTPEAIAEESNTLLGRRLGDPAAPVRLTAIAELHRRGAPPPGLPDLNRMLEDALVATDASIRRAARRELRVILLAGPPDAAWLDRLHLLAEHLDQRADRSETAEALHEVARRHGDQTRPVAHEVIRHVEDRDPRVRAAILALTGHAGLVEEAPRLVSALGARTNEEVSGAREGLVALGTAAVLPLFVGLEFGGARRREAAVAVMRELEVDLETLESLRTSQLAAIHETIVQRAALDSLEGKAAGLLRRRLDERIAEGIGALLDLLSAIHAEPRLMELERRLRRAPEGRERDLMIEAIESLLGHPDRGAVIPLLEPGQRRAEDAARMLGVSIPEAPGALAALSDTPDATTRLLISALALEDAEVIGDPQAMPSAIEIAVRLQDAPAFNRLSTQQLIALAECLQEQKATAGEKIYRAGDEGLGVYFVLDGTIELRRGALILEHAGEGAVFGEISPLDGVPRSEDAIASTDALLLRLDREELMPLLEDAPGLAIGLAELLSSRVRRLEDRLEEAVSPIPPEHDAASGLTGEIA